MSADFHSIKSPDSPYRIFIVHLDTKSKIFNQNSFNFQAYHVIYK